MTQTITVIRGDGIGPEIMEAALHVIDAMDVGLQYEFADAGLVRLRIEREEPAHDLVGLGEDAFVHPLAEGGEFSDAILVAATCATHGAPSLRPLASSSGASLPARCIAIMSS